MKHIVLSSLILLAGCGAQVGGHPDAVLVERDRITVSMSNGWPCTGFRTAETQTENGWAGRLEGCPNSFSYRVVLSDATNPARIVMEEVLGAVGLDDLLRARAVVEITGQGGQVYTFRSPERSESRP